MPNDIHEYRRDTFGIQRNDGEDVECREPINELDQASFQALVLDQITRIQEQNELIKTRVIQLEKEQEDFYLSTSRRLDNGFREVEKCTKEMSSIKEVFKEIVGIMTGDRVQFLDHSSENVTSEEAQAISSSQLLAENFANHRRRQFNDYIHDRRVLERDECPSTLEVKREEDAAWRQDCTTSQQSSFQGHEPDQDLEYSNSHILTNYRLNRAIHTVTDVAREYFEGLRGQPSVMYLERRYGTHWRSKPSERTFFAKRMQIINKINDIKENPERYGMPPGISRKQAIRVVENVRLGNNSFYGHSTRMTLNQLYIYLTKKMDKTEDYNLTLKEHGKPRRDLLSRERLKDSNNTSATQTTEPGIDERSRAGETNHGESNS